MNTGAAICVAGLMAAGMLGGAALYQPEPVATEAAATADPAVREDVAQLKRAVQVLEAGQRQARQEASDALAYAHRLEGEMRKAREGYDEVLALLGRSDAPVASGDVPLGDDGEPAFASAAPAPTRVAVEQALADIRAEQERQREVEREERRARMQEQAKARETERMNRLAESIGLSPQQRTDLEAALAYGEEQRRLLMESMRTQNGDDGQGRGRGRGGFGGTPEEREVFMQQMTQIRDQTRATLESIMSPEQLEAYDQQTQRGGRGRTARQGGPGGQGGGDDGGATPFGGQGGEQGATPFGGRGGRRGGGGRGGR